MPRLIKRATIVARLFYHTAMCLLSQMNPVMSVEDAEMHSMQSFQAHQICGIVAHVKDRGVASVALRSLAIAAECLVVRREQEEVLQIFEKIRKETGWRVGFLNKELKEKWGWANEEALRQQQQMPAALIQNSQMQNFQFQQQGSSLPPAPPIRRRPGENPLATADFSNQGHPYQSYYVAPNQHPHHNHYNF